MIHSRRFDHCPLVMAATLALTLTVGCASKYEDLKVFVQAHNHDVVASTYRIEPPDVVSIASPNCPEVNGVHRVGADGKVMLRLVGPVKISTLTPKEVAVKLERLLSVYYVDPQVEVEVAERSSKRIYVFGQVSNTGAKPFTGRDTLLNVLAEAKPNFIAWGAQVKVIRPSANPDEKHEIIVDVDRMIQSGDLRENMLLQEGDVVYVPPTPLGWVGLRVQEVLFPLNPVLNGYTFPANVYGATNAYDNLDNRQYYGMGLMGSGIGTAEW